MSDGITDYEATRREWVKAFEEEERAKNAALARLETTLEEIKRERLVYFNQLTEFERHRAEFVKRCEEHTAEKRKLREQLAAMTKACGDWKAQAEHVESALRRERNARKRPTKPKPKPVKYELGCYL